MPNVEQFLGPGQLPKLGQGFHGRLPGGGGGGLHPLQGIPHIQSPKAPPINYGAVAQVGRQQRQPPPMSAPPPGVLSAPGFGTKLPSTAMPKLSKIESKAMKAIQHSYNHEYQYPGPKAHALVINPTPKMVQHLNNIPHGGLMHQIAASSAQSYDPTTPAVNKAFNKPLSAPTKQYIHNLQPQQTETAGLGSFTLGPVTNYLGKFATGAERAAIGAGPGMAVLGEHIGMGSTNLGHEVQRAMGLRAGPDYPSQAPFFKALGKSQLESYKQMFTTDQIGKDPFQFWMNVASVASLGAGAGVRLGRLGELADAVKTGELTPIQAMNELRKTPQFSRSIKALPGASNVRVTPPAFKSTLGGLLHTKVIDPLTEKAIEARATTGRPQVYGRSMNVPQTLIKAGERHVGKLLRRDTEMKTNMERSSEYSSLLAQKRAAGELIEDPKVSLGERVKGLPSAVKGAPAKLQASWQQAKDEVLAGGPAEEKVPSASGPMTRAQIARRAFAVGAAKTHLNLWHSLSDGGAGADESFLRDPNGYIGIKKLGTVGEEDLKKYSSTRGIARQWNEMVETNKDVLAASPHDYTYIPRSMWKRLKLDMPASGHASTALNLIDSGNQAIRAGRFIHPGYAAWAVQNGVLHLSQAGMYAIRNVHQLRNDFSRLTPADQAMMDGSMGAGPFGGGIARATAGGEESLFRGGTKRMAEFWHNVDDKQFRRLSLIHELNREGYHSAEDWSHLMHTNPRRFRAIAQRANDEAINYQEMSPAERATMQKLMTAYGWTRGASTYTARFPFQHPIQATVANQLGQTGANQVDKFYAGVNGMAPSWLRGYLPIGHGNHPALLGTSDINPAETFGSVLDATGLVKGPQQPLADQLGPVASSVSEFATGRDRFGKQLTGMARAPWGQPLSDALKRIAPVSYYNDLVGSKHGGGTFTQGVGAAAESFLGVPVSHLRDLKTTAALGAKDWETALSKPDEIQFRYNQGLKDLPSQVQAYTKAAGGEAPGSTYLGMIKGDMAAVERRDMFQYQYAKSKGANSFRSLPATDRVTGGIKFMLDHGYMGQSDARDFTQWMNEAKQQNTEQAMDAVATAVWKVHPVGSIVTRWNATVKKLAPPPLQASRG